MKNTVLIVDDMELNREILREMLENDYDIMEAENGRVALQILKDYHNDIAVILLDIKMPEADGFVVLEDMKQQGFIGRIPVLIISVDTSLDAEKRCFEYKVSDFIGKPFDKALVKRRVHNVIELFRYQNHLEEKVEKQTEALKKQNKLLQLQADKLRKSNTDIIDILGTVVEYRDFESGEHIKRVKGFTAILAEEIAKDYPEYGLTEREIEIISSASAMHDIGKIAIPDNILLKPEKLTEEEYSCMKTHTIRGGEILNNIRHIWDEEYARAGYEICMYHHERYDGKGYPYGLSGEDIPLSAQIVSLADVYDALISERVYKGAYTNDEAYYMILGGECGMFSPKMLECFKKVKTAFEMFASQNINQV